MHVHYCYCCWQHDIVHVITFDVLGMTYHPTLAAAVDDLQLHLELQYCSSVAVS